MASEADNTTTAAPPFTLPNPSELFAFMSAIPPNLFVEYVIVVRGADEMIMCEIRAVAEDGRPLHVRALPFN